MKCTQNRILWSQQYSEERKTPLILDHKFWFADWVQRRKSASGFCYLTKCVDWCKRILTILLFPTQFFRGPFDVSSSPFSRFSALWLLQFMVFSNLSLGTLAGHCWNICKHIYLFANILLSFVLRCLLSHAVNHSRAMILNLHWLTGHMLLFHSYCVHNCRIRYVRATKHVLRKHGAVGGKGRKGMGGWRGLMLSVNFLKYQLG